MGNGEKKVIPATELTEFFKTEVGRARRDLQIELSELTEYYLVNLLCDFSRRDSGPTPGDEPLALMYKRAMEALPAQRLQVFKELGDVALYVSGFFVEFIERSLVDLDYYIAMGGGAYQRASVLVGAQPRGSMFVQLFEQLAVSFTELVDVLNQISDRARDNCEGQADLLRLYDRWVRTGSKRTRRLLVDRGLVPAEGLPDEYVQ